MKLSEDTSVRYHTKIDDRLGGPYSVEGLESLVYLQRITPDTLIAQVGRDDFTPIRHSTLGPVLFKNLTPIAKTPKDWAPPGKENSPDFANRTRYRFTEAKFDNLNAKNAKRGKIDVLDLLDDIRQTEIASGADHVRPTRFRISNRTRDFWLLLIAGNTVFLGTAILMQNTVSLVFGIGGSGLYTFALLWSMFGVMNRY